MCGMACRSNGLSKARGYAGTGQPKAAGPWHRGVWPAPGPAVPALVGLRELGEMRAVARGGRISAGVDAFFWMWAHAVGWSWIERLARLRRVRVGYSGASKFRRTLGCQ